MRTAILIAGWTWVAAALVQFTDVTDDLDWVFGLFFSGLLLGGAWIVALFKFPATDRMRRWWYRWAWWLLPVGALATIVLSETGWGLTARVWLCETKLRTYAEEVQGGRHDNRPLWVGLFRVQSAEGGPAQTRLGIGSEMLDVVGLAYCHKPPDPTDRNYWHLYGPWYRYRQPY